MKRLTKYYPTLTHGDKVKILYGTYLNELAIVVKVDKSKVKLLTLSGAETWISRDRVEKI